MTDLAARADVARRNLAAGRTVESVGTHYSPARWHGQEGGHVGHIAWRDQHRQQSHSYCGHKHRQENDALACIQAVLDAATQAGESA